MAHCFLYALALFLNLFHCPNQENVGNNTVTKDPTTPNMCRYTTFGNVSVLKEITESMTTSVTTHLSVRCPAAKRTHCTFYVKIAGCNSYFRQ